ncbi:neuron-specific protein family [Lynx pardinus]|uniref:Neuronal vesicle trafficking-associated protein 1 n=1 Tax=Lynx pardinus TaxID=191816 RepID=A0A485N4V1_LYNPA|nr:neuron-specific protein family [Lynx pardinus]
MAGSRAGQVRLSSSLGAPRVRLQPSHRAWEPGPLVAPGEGPGDQRGSGASAWHGTAQRSDQGRGAWGGCRRPHGAGDFGSQPGQCLSSRWRARTVSVLVLFALAFLTCVVFLVVYKVYKYDRACPDGFILKNTQCIPEGLESYYAEQDSSAREKFYTVINHYNLAKQSITRSVSPWMSVLSEEKLSEQETEAADKSAQ